MADFKAVVAFLKTQVPYMDSWGIALADCRECELWHAQRDADLFHPLLPVSPRERRSRWARAGQDVPPGRFSGHYRYVVHGPHSLLWIRSRTNSFGSIGKSASAPSTYHGL